MRLDARRGFTVALGVALAATAAAGVAAAATAAAAGPAGGRPAAQAPERSARVLVVTVPALVWADVAAERPPALLGLARRGAVASTSVRTVGPLTSVGDAYATIGAGNRATDAPEAGLAFRPEELVGGEPAGEVFARRSGASVAGAAVVHLGAPAIERANQALAFGARPGALGEALRQGGIAVIGNAGGAPAAAAEGGREVALAAMDAAGRVGAGAVGAELVARDPQAPLGVRQDPRATLAEFDRAWAANQVAIVELSDVLRADRFRQVATAPAAERARAGALAAADALLGQLLGRVDLARDTVLVVAPVSPMGGDQLTVAVAAGPGIEPGLLFSGTTRRPGYVTLPDVAPTVVHRLGLEIPTVMTGAPMASTGCGPPSIRTIEGLVEDNLAELFRNEITPPLTTAIVITQILAYLAAGVAIARGSDRLRGVLMWLVLSTGAIPAVAFLSGLAPYRALGAFGYAAALFAGAALLGAGAALAGAVAARRGVAGAWLVPPVVLAGTTAAVLLVDVVVGGPLQISTLFGYSAIVAGRFAGFGNPAWGILAVAMAIALSGIWGMRRLAREAGRPGPGERDWRFLALAAGALAVAAGAIGLPGLGLNVGGTLSAFPGFVVLLALLAGARISLFRAVAIGVATAGVLVAIAVADLARPPESRTHFGRFLALVWDQGAGGLLTVMERRIDANIAMLTFSTWSLLLPVAIAFFAFLTWRPPRTLKSMQERTPGLRACLVSALVVGVLGAALNDSGVAIPATMLVPMLPYVAYLALHEARVHGRPPAPAGLGPSEAGAVGRAAGGDAGLAPLAARARDA